MLNYEYLEVASTEVQTRECANLHWAQQLLVSRMENWPRTYQMLVRWARETSVRGSKFSNSNLVGDSTFNLQRQGCRIQQAAMSSAQGRKTEGESKEKPTRGVTTWTTCMYMTWEHGNMDMAPTFEYSVQSGRHSNCVECTTTPPPTSPLKWCNNLICQVLGLLIFFYHCCFGHTLHEGMSRVVLDLDKHKCLGRVPLVLSAIHSKCHT